VFVPGKLFKPRRMFVNKAGGLPKGGAPESCFTWVGPGLVCKHWTKLETLAKDKHSSLLQKSVNYCRIVQLLVVNVIKLFWS
jgi:hypothetical protein